MGAPLVHRLSVLVHRPDFREDPCGALSRRLRWRLRWRLTGAPWLLKLGSDLRIEVPRCGAGALIYYQGYSEPETAKFILRYLQPGMVFLDIGAHIGEYTLLASRAVGATGEVHAFEPQPSTFKLLTRNLSLNRLENVHARAAAICESDGQTDFVVREEASLSSIATCSDAIERSTVLGRIKVPCTHLDRYCDECGRLPDLVKIDVEGAELPVLRGASRLLAATKDRSPCIVFEYGPENFEQFGYRFEDLRALLDQFGFNLFQLDPVGRAVPIKSTRNIPPGTRNLVASKRTIPDTPLPLN